MNKGRKGSDVKRKERMKNRSMERKVVRIGRVEWKNEGRKGERRRKEWE